MKKLITLLAILATNLCTSQTVTFSADFDHSITKAEAATMTKLFRTAYPDLAIANAFGNNAIESVKSQIGCKGIRYYNGLDGEGTLHLIGVGIDSSNQDMVDGIIIERSICCFKAACYPCSGNNALNTD